MTTKKEALKQIEEKIEAAKVLVKEARQLAKDNDVTLLVGMIRKVKYEYDEEDNETEVDLEDEDDSGGYITTIAGWSPSGLNC